MNYTVEAMFSLVPNANLSWIGEEWEGLTWYDSRPCPTREVWEAEKARLIAYAPLQACKDTAKTLLAKSDWSVLPDRAAMLENASEFVAYRTELLKLIISPIAEPVFPSEPQPRWKEL